MDRTPATEECARIEALAASWEDRGWISSDDLPHMRSHLQACGACARRFSALIPLLERDAGEGPLPQPRQDGLTDAVMVRVQSSSPRRRVSRVVWAAAAAACLVAAAGAGFSLAGARSRPGADEVVVRFEIEAPGAKSVALAGTFTDWDASKLVMSDADGDGVWQITVRLEKGTVAVYNFVINGSRWVPDPRAPARVDDGFGGQSSVLQL